ncbi:AMP-binding protein [Robiginitalea biformata]|uniref:O-succinylbenzoic acid-CoA ligase n=1 Tax=Robiginitalea biformata (strain ATCC BAA-864 / DSM 15991 / KCTC 12146 / HTCC2501) TaxID=313596 RepID=A4CLN4_ROBBH|nr:AMP-binding protein [Robiginitalea biformata]EAR15783.1 O-succinylbenzoic acid-CoA ligase [Robiginitalea biformata HTCC2501]
MKEAYHPRFQLEGQSFEYSDLKEVAYSLVKEGEPFEKDLGDFLMDWVSDAPYIVQHTSGSTGPPKPIRLAKSALVAGAGQTGEFLGLPAGTRALCCLPFSTIAGKMMLIRALVLGWDIVPVAPSSDPLADVSGRFDFTAMVPLQLRASLSKLDRIDKLIVGGAPVPASLLEILPRQGTEIWETYGMTETGSHVALRKLKPIPPGTNPEEELPPYRALEGISFSLDDRGCLVIASEDRFEKPVVTNDLVSLEGDDSLCWLGRWDHVINSGGVKLIAEQLENRLSAVLSCRYFVAGEPDERLGERLVLYVEGQHDTGELLDRIKASGKFTEYEIPREIYTVEKFAQTGTGKIDRSASENLKSES